MFAYMLPLRGTLLLSISISPCSRLHPLSDLFIEFRCCFIHQCFRSTKLHIRLCNRELDALVLRIGRLKTTRSFRIFTAWSINHFPLPSAEPDTKIRSATMPSITQYKSAAFFTDQAFLRYFKVVEEQLVRVAA